MVYAVLKQAGDTTASLFNNFEEYHRATFNPTIETETLIELDRIPGKTYQDKKACIEAKAIDYSNSCTAGLSYGELADIQEYFERYGKRYGLLTDFRENAIC